MLRRSSTTFSRATANPRDITWKTAAEIAELKDAAYDDVVYFGANADNGRETLPQGRRARPVQHCPMRRQIRPAGGVANRARPLRRHPPHRHNRVRSRRGDGCIPATAEIRANDKINIVGAAGPMGTMHVIRDLCQGVPGVTIFAGDLSDERLAMLQKAGRAAGPKEQTLTPALQSVERQAGRDNSITSS